MFIWRRVREDLRALPTLLDDPATDLPAVAPNGVNTGGQTWPRAFIPRGGSRGVPRGATGPAGAPAAGRTGPLALPCRHELMPGARPIGSAARLWFRGCGAAGR
ncbi:hypothetical protein GCM10008956_37690 [Deinococcus arenae]|uniref:Uncharacterized protein n=1 Tax=Deinococcus arenae TaxID=1452751 RepID=A0A8H9GSN9_9DEIO|nr:hypothetical protein GCM10008956_37690 [Deinococcus arenae]